MDPPQEGARKIYEEPELPNLPMADNNAPRTTFLVKDLQYVPKNVYCILAKTLSLIKGYNLDNEAVVGVM